jgi:molecular chaperone GrpE
MQGGDCLAEKKDDSLKRDHETPQEDPSTKSKDQLKNHDKLTKKDSNADSATDHRSSEIKKLKQQVTDLQTKYDQMENRFLRAEADMKNIQNHAKKEQADLIKYDGQQLAHDILPIVDNLQRALAVDVTDDSGKQLKKGVSMVYEHLTKALSDNGVEVIEALNKPFDPKFSQAVQTAAADDHHPVDTVVQILQNGYRLKDRVLRPAMVVVAK